MKRSLYLGVDVSKGYADFCLLNADKQLIGIQFQLFDVEEDYIKLFDYLKEIVGLYQPDVIYAAVESTGSYENHWLRKLFSFSKELPIIAYRLNPTSVLKNRQAILKEQVTDRTSSRYIADYLINHTSQISHYSPDHLSDLRSFLSQINLYNNQKVQLSNSLHHLLYNYFPEIVPKSRNGFPEYILELLQKYPTTTSLAKAHNDSYKNIPYLPEETWHHLRERCKMAKRQESNRLILWIIRNISKQIQTLTHRIDEMFDLLRSELPEEELKILMSVPGIGIRTAIILLCTIGDVNRFGTAHQIVSYFGLYPVIKESGDGKKRPYMSKKGNHLLRKYLYMATMVACHKDPYISSLYENLVNNGMHKKKAICRMMNKLLRMVYGMLRKHREYNHKIDEDNRTKYQKRKLNTETSPQTKEKLTDLLITTAPISKKNIKNRKEQKLTLARTRSSKRNISAPS